jgi:hypothetical protein
MSHTKYTIANVLAKIAAFLYVPGIAPADWKEDLKCQAARENLLYNPDLIDRALTIAEQRLRETGKWQPDSKPASPPRIDLPRIPTGREAHRVFRELLKRIARLKSLKTEDRV